MQDKATLNPTPDQTFEIVGQGAYDFVRVLTHSCLLYTSPSPRDS
mgnify:CR=1 FL=1